MSDTVLWLQQLKGLLVWCRYVGACSDAHMRCVYNMKFVTGLKMRTFPMPTFACLYHDSYLPRRCRDRFVWPAQSMATLTGMGL